MDQTDIIDKTSFIFIRIIEPFGKFIQKTNDLLYSYGQSAGMITAIIILLSGILLAFWGYRLKKAALILVGFIMGAYICVYATHLITLSDRAWQFLIIFIGGIIGALIITFLYKTVIIISGVLLGLSLGLVAGTMLELSTLYIVIIGAIPAVLGGFLAFKIEKIMFIIITCYYGYFLFKIGLAGTGLLKDYKVVEQIIGFAVLAGGAIFQFYEHFHVPKASPPPPPPPTQTVTGTQTKT